MGMILRARDLCIEITGGSWVRLRSLLECTSEEAMSEVERIVDQMKQTHIGNPWTDRPFERILVGVTGEVAASKPIPDAHSIWEIVLHLMTAQELILDLVRGTTRPYEPGDEWPPVQDSSEAAWAETVKAFFDGDAEVRAVVGGEFREEKLDEPFREGGISAYNNLHGYIQHAVFHGGQISLLKILAERRTP
jgi:hypothetical protein